MPARLILYVWPYAFLTSHFGSAIPIPPLEVEIGPTEALTPPCRYA